MLVQLRNWHRADAPRLAQIANSPKIEANLRDGFPTPYGVEDAKAFLDTVLASQPDEVLFQAILAEGEVVGSISATRGKNIYRMGAEIGYFIAESHWGKGIATEAIRQLVPMVFTAWDVVRLYAEPFAHNFASRRALQKAGFDEEAILENNVIKHKAVHSTVIYRLLK